MGEAKTGAAAGAGDASEVKGPTERKAYSVEAFCEAYDIGRSTAYVEMTAGRLEFFKVGSRTLISVDAADAWCRSRQEETRAKRKARRTK